MTGFRRSPSCMIVLLFPLIGLAFAACTSHETGDDDTGPPPSTPWDGFAPSGPAIDQALGVSSHLYTGPDPSLTRDFELEKLAEAGIRRIRRDFYWSEVEHVYSNLQSLRFSEAWVA